jgi:hypothetical protein
MREFLSAEHCRYRIRDLSFASADFVQNYRIYEYTDGANLHQGTDAIRTWKCPSVTSLCWPFFG